MVDRRALGGARSAPSAAEGPTAAAAGRPRGRDRPRQGRIAHPPRSQAGRQVNRPEAPGRANARRGVRPQGGPLPDPGTAGRPGTRRCGRDDQAGTRDGSWQRTRPGAAGRGHVRRPLADRDQVSLGRRDPGARRGRLHGILGDRPSPGRRRTAAGAARGGRRWRTCVSTCHSCARLSTLSCVSVACRQRSAVHDYVEFLASAYFLLIAYFWRSDSDSEALSKDKKLYFGDPLLCSVAGDLPPRCCSGRSAKRGQWEFPAGQLRRLAPQANRRSSGRPSRSANASTRRRRVGIQSSSAAAVPSAAPASTSVGKW